jgi:hypothetical protein
LQTSKFAQDRGHVTHAERTVMGGRFGTPGIHEFGGGQVEANAAVGVANSKGGTGDGVAFGDEKFELPTASLGAAKDRHRAMFDAEFDGNAIARLAMIETEAAQERFV